MTCCLYHKPNLHTSFQLGLLGIGANGDNWCGEWWETGDNFKWECFGWQVIFITLTDMLHKITPGNSLHLVAAMAYYRTTGKRSAGYTCKS